MKKLPISVCMIVRDESFLIRAALEAIQDWVEDLVIIDVGSADETVKIAREFSSQVFEMGWTKDFSKARQLSIEKANQPWVFVLNADEILDYQAKTLFQKINFDLQDRAYVLEVQDYTHDRSRAAWRFLNLDERSKLPLLAASFLGAVNSKSLRLFPKKAFRNFEYPIAEECRLSNEVKQISLAPPAVIHHLFEARLEPQRTERLEIFIEDLRRHLLKNPKHFQGWKKLGFSLLKLAKKQEALAALSEANRLQADDLLLKLELAKLNLVFERYEDSLGILQDLNAEEDFLRAEVLGQLSTAYMYQGKFELSQKAYEAALELEPTHFMARVNAAVLAFEHQDAQATETHLEMALRIHPQDTFLQSALQRAQKRSWGNK